MNARQIILLRKSGLIKVVLRGEVAFAGAWRTVYENFSLLEPPVLVELFAELLDGFLDSLLVGPFEYEFGNF